MNKNSDKNHNEDYNKKKRVTISVLSALALCLAACLVWYMGTMGRTELPVMEREIPETEVSAAVPEIEGDGIRESENGPESGNETEPRLETEEPETLEAEPGENGVNELENGTEAEESPVEESSGGEVPAVPETPSERTDGNPQTPEEALPPSEPPTGTESSVAVENPDESGNCQPEHTPPQENQPQGGDVNPNGAVYVPGFGYIEYSGPNEQEDSYTDGDWEKQIGTMQ